MTGDNQCCHGRQDDTMASGKTIGLEHVLGVACPCIRKSGDANKLSKKNYILFMRYVKKILQKKKYNAPAIHNRKESD